MAVLKNPPNSPHPPEVVGTMVIRENTLPAKENGGDELVAQCWYAGKGVPKSSGIAGTGKECEWDCYSPLGLRGQAQVEGVTVTSSRTLAHSRRLARGGGGNQKPPRNRTQWTGTGRAGRSGAV